jgi:hypothetical protein
VGHDDNCVGLEDLVQFRHGFAFLRTIHLGSLRFGGSPRRLKLAVLPAHRGVCHDVLHGTTLNALPPECAKRVLR